ncbi:MAG: class I SAM-dependent methyltransferase, partial [Shewanella sp.]
MPIQVFFNQQYPTLVDICARWQLVYDANATFE